MEFGPFLKRGNFFSFFVSKCNKDAASVTGCLLKNFKLASLKSYLKYFKYLKKDP